MMQTPVPVVGFSPFRTVGPVILTGSLAVALLVSLAGFNTYEGAYSSWAGLVVLAVVTLLLLVLFLPISAVDCALLLRQGCAAYVSGGRLGIYRASPWMPWVRGFVEVPLKDIRSIEVAGRSARWGDVLRFRIDGQDDLTVETFYMRGRTELVLNDLRAAALQPLAGDGSL